MILPVSPKVVLGNKYSMLNAHESGRYKIQLINFGANIPLPNKFALTRFTKNLFKNPTHQQAS